MSSSSMSKVCNLPGAVDFNSKFDKLDCSYDESTLACSSKSMDSCDTWRSDVSRATSSGSKSVRFNEVLVETFVIPSRKEIKKASRIKFCRDVEVKYIPTRSHWSSLSQDLWYNNEDFEVFAAYSDTNEALNEIIDYTQNDFDQLQIVNKSPEEIYSSSECVFSLPSSSSSRISPYLPSICSTSKKQAPLKVTSVASANITYNKNILPSILK